MVELRDVLAFHPDKVHSPRSPCSLVSQIDKVYEARGERFFDTLDARRVLAQARIDYPRHSANSGPQLPRSRPSHSSHGFAREHWF